MRNQFLLPTVGVIKPTDKIALGSFIEDIEEMHKKTIDPVTGRLFLKYSLQDDLKKKLEREKQWMEERFDHIETEKQYSKLKEDAEDQFKIIREMQVDNDQILPNERTRQWMLAQTHIMMERGEIEYLQMESEIEKLANPDSKHKYQKPSDVDRHRAKQAYNKITTKMEQRDLNSDNLFEDLISERAFEVDRFVSQDQSIADEIIKEAQSQLARETNVESEIDKEDSQIKKDINKLMF